MTAGNEPPQPGWVYELVLTDEREFMAIGLDAAHRVMGRLNEAIWAALNNDPDVMRSAVKLRVKGSPKNFLQKGAT